MTHCPNCLKEIDTGLSACPYCGVTFEARLKSMLPATPVWHLLGGIACVLLLGVATAYLAPFAALASFFCALLTTFGFRADERALKTPAPAIFWWLTLYFVLVVRAEYFLLPSLLPGLMNPISPHMPLPGLPQTSPYPGFQ